MTFNSDQLLADAEQATGLSDWGGEQYFEHSFRTLFSAMALSVATESGLNAQGLHGAHLRLQAMAQARLQFVDDRKQNPDIATEEIKAPLIILGLPRAGSTFLHSLLACDPDNRHPQTWEMMLPSPPPQQDSYATDPRIDRAQAILNAMGLDRPEITALHPFGARQPEECHLLMELMGLGDNLPALWRMPTFNKVRATIDLREGYILHRMALQNLQYRYKGKRWVLKNPGHVFYLEHLLAVYPDAQLVQTHRDPAKVIPSVTALIQAMRQANSEHTVAGEKIALGNMKAFAAGLGQAIEFRQTAGMENHFHDVHFDQLIEDPLGVVAAIYDQFGISLSEIAIKNMRQWLASENKHQAKTRYTLQQYGLQEDQVHQAFAKYLNHYRIKTSA